MHIYKYKHKYNNYTKYELSKIRVSYIKNLAYETLLNKEKNWQQIKQINVMISLWCFADNLD